MELFIKLLFSKFWYILYQLTPINNYDIVHFLSPCQTTNCLSSIYFFLIQWGKISLLLFLLISSKGDHTFRCLLATFFLLRITNLFCWVVIHLFLVGKWCFYIKDFNYLSYIIVFFLLCSAVRFSVFFVVLCYIEILIFIYQKLSIF